MIPTQAQRIQPTTNNTLFAGMMSNAVARVAAMTTACADHFSNDSTVTPTSMKTSGNPVRHQNKIDNTNPGHLLSCHWLCNWGNELWPSLTCFLCGEMVETQVKEKYNSRPPQQPNDFFLWILEFQSKVKTTFAGIVVFLYLVGTGPAELQGCMGTFHQSPVGI